MLAVLALGTALMSGCYHIPIGEPVPLQPAEPETLKTATFSFEPLDISPLPITAGQPFAIKLTIENTGNATDTYKADLLIDGKLISSQAITVKAGTKESAHFQAVIATGGKHEVKAGPQARVLDVIEKRVQTTLKLNGEQIDGFDALVGSTSTPSEIHGIVEGHLIQLTAPEEGFVINTIRIMGYIKSSTYDYDSNPIYGPGIWVYGSDIALAEPLREDFTVNIYDNRRNRLYSGDFKKMRFTYLPGWVFLDIEPVTVSGDFFIEVNTYNPPRLNATGWGDWDPWHRYVVHTWYYQLCIGYENAIYVQSFASQDGSIVPGRYFTYNWLIQAAGYRQ